MEEEEYSIKQVVEEMRKINENLEYIAQEVIRGTMGNGK